MGENKQVLDKWSFKACNEHVMGQQWMEAAVPGCVHTDLLRNGRIQHPFYGTNEHNLQWIDKIDWEYQSTFDLTADLRSLPNVELVFDGLDTYADVTLNGRHILSADNMFRGWRVDVRSILKEEGNVLHIVFRSPIQEDLPKLEKLGYSLPAANDQSELGGLGDRKVSIFARKAPYHYGWDWGPRFVTSGIWREVRLEGWSMVKLTDLYVDQRHVCAERAELCIAAEIQADQDWEGMLVMNSADQAWELPVSLQQGVNNIEMPIEIKMPKLWWCRGLGEPSLYSFTAELVSHNSRQSIASRTVRTGLRTIKLIRNKDANGSGASFYFELNGIPVFAKGANHIPNDSFLTDVSEERYRHEIWSAVQSNMNMLRVWGGGFYEQSIFYELCDEYGLLVWQDFMFACSMYPGDEAFLESIRQEAAYNIKRLRNHPCIALWCGNNEIDTAWSHYDEEGGWGWKKLYSSELRSKLWYDYEAVFHHILPEAVTAYASNIDYWPSSPLVSLTGDSRQHSNPYTNEGDIHYWGVWHQVEPFENYNKKIGRFMSEYGFQSFPEYSTIRSFAEESDLRIDSSVMLAHQKNGDGNRLIKEYMDIYMSRPKDFRSFLYMSQVLQAEAMKMAIEAHRRKMPYCMGSLYWQMNDCWPVASWAGIDYYGKWKALQYYARRSFSEQLISFEKQDDDMLLIYLVADGLKQLEGLLMVQLLDFDGRLLKEQSVPVRAAAGSAVPVVSLHEAEWLAGLDTSRLVLVAQLQTTAGEEIEAEHYFVSSKDMKLDAAEITITEATGSGGTQYVLTTNKLAKQVRLTPEHEGFFTDNYFDLIPGRPKTVQFIGGKYGSADLKPSAAGRLEAQSMIDFLAVSNNELL